MPNQQASNKITLLLGRAGSGKTRACFQGVADFLRATDGGAPFRGPRAILLTPVQATYFAELELIRHLKGAAGATGYSRAHVLSFRRLALRVFGETGGPELAPADALKKKLLIRKILIERAGELSVFGRAAANRLDFASRLASLFRELSSLQTSPETLLKTADGQKERLETFEKLRDIALLYGAYRDTLKRAGTGDPDLDLDLVARKIAGASFAKGAGIFADGFADFTAQELAVLTALAREADSMTIALCVDPAIANANPDEELDPLFHPTHKLLARLIEHFEREGLGTPDIRAVEKHRGRFLTAALTHLERAFMKFPPSRLSGSPDGLTVFESPNPHEEAAWAAAEIRRLAAEENYRYRDVAILVRDVETYRAPLEAAFEELGIPRFFDRRQEARRHPLIALIRAAVAGVADGWQTRDVLEYLKTGLVFPDDPAPVDELENFALERNLSGRLWRDGGAAWKKLVETPGLEQAEKEDFDPLETAESGETVYSRLEDYRRRAVEALKAFDGNMRAACGKDDLIGAGPFVRAVGDLLEALRAEKTLVHWEKREDAGADHASAMHRQAWNLAGEFFQSFEEIMGGDLAPLAEMAQIVSSGLADLRMGMTPSSLDQVLIGAVDRSRQPSLRACFLLGFNEKAWPMRPGARALLNDRDRETIADRARLDLKSARDDLSAENYLAYIALTRASERVYIGYSAADDRGKELAPSIYLRRVMGMFPNLKIKRSADEREGSLAVRPPTLAGAFTALASHTREAAEPDGRWLGLYERIVETAGKGKLAPTAAELSILKILADRNAPGPLPKALTDALVGAPLRASVTRIENFALCPFRHFAKYLLGLKPRAAFRLGSLELGGIYHGVLDRAWRKMNGRGKSWSDIADRELADIVRESLEEEAKEKTGDAPEESGKTRFLIEQAGERLELVAGFLQKLEFYSEFKQVRSELAFGLKDAEAEGLTLNLDGGGQMVLNGKIDRVDACRLADGGMAVRVVDYKMKNPQNLKFDFAKVWHGLELQLMTYLLYLAREGEKIFGVPALPASAVYAPIRTQYRRNNSPDEAAGTESLDFFSDNRFTGALDSDYLRRVDTTLESGGKSNFFKVKLNKDGEPDGYSREVISGEMMDGLLARAEKALREHGSGICAGRIDISPALYGKDLPCNYCDFKDFCRFDETEEINEPREFKKMSAEETLEALGGAIESAPDDKDA